MIVRMILRLPKSAVKVVIVGICATRDDIGHKILTCGVEAVLVVDAECTHSERLFSNELAEAVVDQHPP